MVSTDLLPVYHCQDTVSTLPDSRLSAFARTLSIRCGAKKIIFVTEPIRAKTLMKEYWTLPFCGNRLLHEPEKAESIPVQFWIVHWTHPFSCYV